MFPKVLRTANSLISISLLTVYLVLTLQKKMRKDIKPESGEESEVKEEYQEKQKDLH